MAVGSFNPRQITGLEAVIFLRECEVEKAFREKLRPCCEGDNCVYQHFFATDRPVWFGRYSDISGIQYIWLAFSCFFVGLLFPPHFDFGNQSVKKKKQQKPHKCQQILAELYKNCLHKTLFQMIKIEMSAHYLIFWTQSYHIHSVQVINRNNICEVCIFWA